MIIRIIVFAAVLMNASAIAKDFNITATWGSLEWRYDCSITKSNWFGVKEALCEEKTKQWYSIDTTYDSEMVQAGASTSIKNTEDGRIQMQNLWEIKNTNGDPVGEVCSSGSGLCTNGDRLFFSNPADGAGKRRVSVWLKKIKLKGMDEAAITQIVDQLAPLHLGTADNSNRQLRFIINGGFVKTIGINATPLTQNITCELRNADCKASIQYQLIYDDGAPVNSGAIILTNKWSKEINIQHSSGINVVLGADEQTKITGASNNITVDIPVSSRTPEPATININLAVDVT